MFSLALISTSPLCLCSSSLQVVCSLTILSTSRVPSLLLSFTSVRRISSLTSKGRKLLGATHHTFISVSAHWTPGCTLVHLFVCLSVWTRSPFTPSRPMERLAHRLGAVFGSVRETVLPADKRAAAFLFSLHPDYPPQRRAKLTQSNTRILRETCKSRLNFGLFV